MKTLAFILAGLFTSLIFIGVIFRLQHWYMGDLLSIIGVIGFAFISVQVYTYNLYLISKK